MANLYVGQDRQNGISQSQINKDILSYIENSDSEYYDDAISGDSREKVFFQLSSLRMGILSWYDFSPKSHVLEIGAGFGAITGCLCDKCEHVTVTERSEFRAKALTKRYKKRDNLDIYVGDVFEVELQNKYDYVVLIGLLERIGNGSSDKNIYSAYLNRISQFLKPGGKLLLAVENRMGLRYFCGAPESHTNKAFDGINGYPGRTTGRSFSKKELENIIQAAGLLQTKFYYPLPDYKVPQLIFSDEYLPENNLKERLIPYYMRNDTLVADEQELYSDIISNGVFPFFANSYLVECEKESISTPGKVIYATISTDRGKEKSFATTIFNNMTVRKMPLYEEGKISAKMSFNNIIDLQAHGIPVVPHEMLEDDCIQMPFVKWPTLSNYLKELMKDNVEEFLQMIDVLYENILKSAEHVSDGPDGPVLKRAYMELIPLNCFINPETKELLYFDQEFVKDNFSAQYVLFRAIHYIYCFTPNAEKYYPKRKLIEKYNMTETWDSYMKEEQEFLRTVRNHDKYKQFYKWTAVDHKRIAENALRLESEAEKIANYAISHEMKQIWKIELQMLDEVDRICKENKLKYFLVHGSLNLGRRFNFILFLHLF